MRIFHALGIAVCLIAMNVPASAQWVNYPDPRTPRTADGKPNLTAPVPRLADGTPDFSGIWRRPDTKYLVNLGADGIEIPMQPWAEKLYKERQANDSKDWPNGRCIPNSVTNGDGHPTLRKIIQQPGLIVLLFETYIRQLWGSSGSDPELPRKTQNSSFSANWSWRDVVAVLVIWLADSLKP